MWFRVALVRKQVWSELKLGKFGKEFAYPCGKGSNRVLGRAAILNKVFYELPKRVFFVCKIRQKLISWRKSKSVENNA